MSYFKLSEHEVALHKLLLFNENPLNWTQINWTKVHRILKISRVEKLNKSEFFFLDNLNYHPCGRVRWDSVMVSPFTKCHYLFAIILPQNWGKFSQFDVDKCIEEKPPNKLPTLHFLQEKRVSSLAVVGWSLEIQTKVHPKVRNHGEGLY